MVIDINRTGLLKNNAASLPCGVDVILDVAQHLALLPV
jgi:alpha-D-ribose 1-methylphosphonate 5-triphosphate synthase subunit PhnH